MSARRFLSAALTALGMSAAALAGCADALGFKSFTLESRDASVPAEGGSPPSSEAGSPDAAPDGPGPAPCSPGCGEGEKCQNGACVCDPVACTGCCSGTTCSHSWPGCGAGGGACAGCDARSDRCDGNGGCACGSGMACTAGQQCVGGACKCDATNCSGTCCGETCIATDTDTANCGVCGHSCLGAACAKGLCAPATVAASGPPAWAISLNSTNVFWVTQRGVYSAPLAGGAASGPFASVVNGTSYSFAETDPIQFYDNGVSPPMVLASGSSTNGAEILSMNPDGSSPIGAQGIGGPWHLDDDGLYWFGGSEVFRRPIENGALAVVLSGLNLVTDVRGDNNNFYVATSSALLACPKATSQCGTTPVVIAQAGSPDYIATEPDALNVYFANEKAIYRCPYTGCPDPTNPPLWTGTQQLLSSFVADADALYWVDNGKGAILKCAHGASCAVPTTLASGLDQPWGIAVDSSWVYWTLAGGTTGVQRVAK